jgi:hypothetical protein
MNGDVGFDIDYAVNKMPVLYVSGKFSHDDLLHGVEHNVLIASKYSLEGWSKGFAVICPHKNSQGFQHSDLPWEIWMLGDLAFIARMQPERGDALLMLPGWEESRGACIERDYAVERGLDIYYAENGIPEAPVQRGEP